MHALYEINSEVWLREQPWAQGAEKPDLADIPEEQLRAWHDMGIDAVWFLGVWRKGLATRKICLQSEGLLEDFRERLPDFDEAEVVGSPFSIAAYEINPALGDEDTLPRLREKLHAHDLKLILDFVPNHLAVDHPWTHEHPDRFVRGTSYEAQNEPANWFRVPGYPDIILAHGRDPYFPGWTDTAQVNVFSPEARTAMIELLLHVADRCDGVRCDMAMLVLNDVFKRTWGDISALSYPDGDPPEFWTDAIDAVRERHPDFVFMAEVYWDLEPRLQTLGFDYTYDKTLYDLLLGGRGDEIRRHIYEKREGIRRLVHFVENHDEARAAKALGPRQAPAAALAASLPGLTLYHEGQFEGRHVRIPVQLRTRPREDADPELRAFYERLLRACAEPVMRQGEFRPLYVRPAWDGNDSHRGIVTFLRHSEGQCRLVALNVGVTRAQAWTEFPVDLCRAPLVVLEDKVGEGAYCRSMEELEHVGLYLDMPEGACSIFEVYPAPDGAEADRY